MNTYFLHSSIKLIFAASLLWLFIILMLSFISRYFFSSLRIVIKSSWLISLFINASDILLSMLFNLLLARMTRSYCVILIFFLSRSNWKCKTTTCPHCSCRCSNNRDKWCNRNPTNHLLKYSKEAIYLLRFLLISSLSLISAVK